MRCPRLKRVLVLTFKSLDTCESVYLNLHRRSTLLHSHLHKTIVLCSKEQVNQAYKLCHEGVLGYTGLVRMHGNQVSFLVTNRHLTVADIDSQVD